MFTQSVYLLHINLGCSENISPLAASTLGWNVLNQHLINVILWSRGKKNSRNWLILNTNYVFAWKFIITFWSISSNTLLGLGKCMPSMVIRRGFWLRSREARVLMQNPLAKIITKPLFLTISLNPTLKKITIWLWCQVLLPWSKHWPFQTWYESTFKGWAQPGASRLGYMCLKSGLGEVDVVGLSSLFQDCLG